MARAAMPPPSGGLGSVSAREMAETIDSVLTGHHPNLDSEALLLSTNLKRIVTLLGHREFEAVHKRVDCPASGFRVLAMLWIFGEMSTGEIRKLSGVSRQALAGVLNTLEARGLLEKDRATGVDRRRYTVGITAEGIDLIRPALWVQNEVHSRFFDVLEPAEQRQLATLLNKVLAGQTHLVAGL